MAFCIEAIAVNNSVPGEGLQKLRSESKSIAIELEGIFRKKGPKKFEAYFVTESVASPPF
jgi:hypothetical protein